MHIITLTDLVQIEHLFADSLKSIYPPTFIGTREHVLPSYINLAIACLQNNVPVGRLAVLYNRDMSLHLGQWQIGHYECIDNVLVSHTLLNAAFDAIRALGGNEVIGPMNGSTWHSYRFADPITPHPWFMLEKQHNVWYANQFRAVGMKPLARYYSAEEALTCYSDQDINSILSKNRQERVNVRTLDLSHITKDLLAIGQLSNISFANNYLFSPLPTADFLDLYYPVLSHIDPQWVLLAERDGQLIGYLFAIPDYLNSKDKTLVVKTVARHPDDMFRGLGTWLCALLVQKARLAGFDRLIHALIMDENAPSKHMSAIFEGQPFRYYTLFHKTL